MRSRLINVDGLQHHERGHDATTHVDEETKRLQDDTYATAGAQADGGSAEGRAKDLTCNEAEVDALLSSGEST